MQKAQRISGVLVMRLRVRRLLQGFRARLWTACFRRDEDSGLPGPGFHRPHWIGQCWRDGAQAPGFCDGAARKSGSVSWILLTSRSGQEPAASTDAELAPQDATEQSKQGCCHTLP